MGALNGEPTMVQIIDPQAPSGAVEVDMVGGQNYCQRTSSGYGVVSVRFNRPYEKSTPSKPWTIKRTFLFKAGETDLLLDAQAWSCQGECGWKRGWHSGWELRRATP
jgi:hypothetical protein